MKMRNHSPGGVFPASAKTPRNLLFAGFCLWLAAGCTESGSVDADIDDHRTHPGAESIDWVSYDAEGNLVYGRDARGNRIPDFSTAGYRGGGVAIPDVPVVEEVEPGEGDDGERIQAAIDRVAGRSPDSDGFRGAVLLKRGTYEIEDQVRISHGGIVLRGEGQGEDGTVVIGTGNTQRALIVVEGAGEWEEVAGSRQQIVDAYVPVGATGFEVEDGHNFEVGDAVIVHRPSTEEWISAIGMDRIPERHDGRPVRQWTPGPFDLFFDRTVAEVSGNRIVIDVPLTMALDQRFGGGSVYQYEFPGRIENVGVENMRGIAEIAEGADAESEDHAWIFVRFDRLKNGWIRDITSYHFGFALAQVAGRSKWVTVQDSRYLEPVSEIRGSRRYPFHVGGQQNLFQRLYSEEARRDFSTGRAVAGPNVVLDSEAYNAVNYTGPHHRWATGVLYDNVRVPHEGIRVQNRLNYGSGHGWPGANIVFWNCSAEEIIVESPPTARNWSIGSKGRKGEPAFVRNGHHSMDDFPGTWISHGEHVEPRSLYLEQLRERSGEAAVDNIADRPFSFAD